jgi:hypothetical protein
VIYGPKDDGTYVVELHRRAGWRRTADSAENFGRIHVFADIFGCAEMTGEALKKRAAETHERL